ncbi:hypothetical protein AMECASPLE_017786 [Ameca splendens]|uniref:Uncharacterized protein n=1 Tax=Ameca splendens TaxID=208324 RepID=A0ABV0YQV7_9TELE
MKLTKTSPAVSGRGTKNNQSTQRFNRSCHDPKLKPNMTVQGQEATRFFLHRAPSMTSMTIQRTREIKGSCK